LSDVLNRTITITLKFQEEIINHVIPNNMVWGWHGQVYVELDELAININRSVISGLDSFFSFLLRFEPKKAHNILCLTLDPQYKNLHIVTPWSWGRGSHCPWIWSKVFMPNASKMLWAIALYARKSKCFTTNPKRDSCGVWLGHIWHSKL
jgi:hypothetical protein